MELKSVLSQQAAPGCALNEIWRGVRRDLGEQPEEPELAARTVTLEKSSDSEPDMRGVPAPQSDG